MFPPVEVYRARFRHPFYWSLSTALFIALAPVVALGTPLLYFHSSETHVRAITEERVLDARRREILQLKLAGVEPFVWRPVLLCKNFAHTKIAPGCLPVEIGFAKAPLQKNIYSRFSGGWRFVEPTAASCKVCHRSAMPYVEWSFKNPLKSDLGPIQQWLQPAALGGLGWLAIWLLYVFARLLKRLFASVDIVAVALVWPGLPPRAVAENVYKKRFIYVEVGDKYLRGYLSRRQLTDPRERQVRRQGGVARRC